MESFLLIYFSIIVQQLEHRVGWECIEVLVSQSLSL